MDGKSSIVRRSLREMTDEHISQGKSGGSPKMAREAQILTNRSD